MIRSFRPDGAGGLAETGEPPEDALWIDLHEPDAAELDRIGRAVGMALPTREDMEEIELSSRLYRELGTDFMTLVLPALGETAPGETAPGRSAHHQTLPVTFALGERMLVTIRYHDPRPFRTYPSRAARSPYGVATAQDILFGLLDSTIDRLADILELTDGRIEAVSRQLFDKGTQFDSGALRGAVSALGQAGTLVSDVRNSLVTVERAISFLDRERDGAPQARRAQRALKVLSSDVTSLSEHATFLTQKLALIMDAAFNLTNIRQNATSEVFSLVAVLFLPPTLIASIFGMNFAWMPWLDWDLGFWAALATMGLSSLVSYLLFRWRSLL
ncbi:MAG TPA: CorA family divalent cation transporter [Paracoccaceae bacterium]|nr:CorA family divalent cation transporter [Paracoccaceae bacterium]